MSAPLDQQRLDEIAARVEAAEDGWRVVPDPDEPYRFEIHGDGPTIVAVFGGDSYPVRENAEFAAHARADVPALLAEVDRLAVERHETNESLDGAVRTIRKQAGRIAALEKALAATGRSLSSFIFDSSDPGSDALAAQWLYQQAMPAQAADDPFTDAHQYRTEILSDAAKRQRAFIDSDDYVSEDWEAAHTVVDLIDPDQVAEGGERR